jgi:hypothetical protein
MATPKRLLDVQLELLDTELAHITGAIRQNDEMTRSLKNWAIVTWTGSVGLALKDPDLHRFVWVTAVVPLVFWIVDGSFRRIQRTFIARLEAISEYVSSPAFRGAVETGSALDFPLLVMRRKTGRFKDRLLGAMLFRSVWLLYVGLALASLAAWRAVS